MGPVLLSKRKRSPSDLPGLWSVYVCVRVSVHVRACMCVSSGPGWLTMDCILEENIKSLQSFTPSSPLKRSWLMRERDRCGEGEREGDRAREKEMENRDSLSPHL